MRRNLNTVPELPCGAHLLAVAYGTGKDDYLAVVLGFIPHNEGSAQQFDKYVTWIWNSDPGCEGFGEGHYFERFNGGLEGFADKAWRDFTERAQRFAMKAHLWNEYKLLETA